MQQFVLLSFILQFHIHSCLSSSRKKTTMVRKNKKVKKSVLVREEVLPSSSNEDDEEDVVSETEGLNTKRPVTSVETNESKGVVIETSIPSTTNVPAIPVLVHPVNLAVTGNV
jgi:hypothetical protein